MHETLTDEELVARILTIPKNKPFMEELYSRYEKQVYYKCLLLSRDAVFAKDLTQEVFIKVFTKLDTFRGDSKFKYWILRVTHNSCLNFLRKKKKDLVFEDINEEITETKEGSGEEAEIPLAELAQAIQQLEPEEVYLLNLKYSDELKVYEIAEMLQLSESAVKMRLKRLREKLSQIIKPQLS